MGIYRVGIKKVGKKAICSYYFTKIIRTDDPKKAISLYEKSIKEDKDVKRFKRHLEEFGLTDLTSVEVLEEIPIMFKDLEDCRMPLGSRYYIPEHKKEIIREKPAFLTRSALVKLGSDTMLELTDFMVKKDTVDLFPLKKGVEVPVDFYLIRSHDPRIPHTIHTAKKDFFYMVGLLEKAKGLTKPMKDIPLEYYNLITTRASTAAENKMKNFMKEQNLKGNRKEYRKPYPCDGLHLFFRNYGQYLFDKMFYEFILGKDLNF